MHPKQEKRGKKRKKNKRMKPKIQGGVPLHVARLRMSQAY